MNWTLGLSISLIGGGIVSWVFLAALRKYMKVSKDGIDQEGTQPAPPWLTGVIERLLFTILIGFKIPGAPAAMLIWLTLKMATNWNSLFREKAPSIIRVRLAFSALLAGLVSMIFAVIGGVICQSTL